MPAHFYFNNNDPYEILFIKAQNTYTCTNRIIDGDNAAILA